MRRMTVQLEVDIETEVWRSEPDITELLAAMQKQLPTEAPSTTWTVLVARIVGSEG